MAMLTIPERSETVPESAPSTSGVLLTIEIGQQGDDDVEHALLRPFPSVRATVPSAARSARDGGRRPPIR